MACEETRPAEGTQAADRLDNLLRQAAEQTDNPRLRRWLLALLAGDQPTTSPAAAAAAAAGGSLPHSEELIGQTSSSPAAAGAGAGAG